jgi:hypothetical protein
LLRAENGKNIFSYSAQRTTWLLLRAHFVTPAKAGVFFRSRKTFFR